MTSEIHEGPLEHAPAIHVPAADRKQKKSWSEQRWERRRRRMWFEEILGWILVPIILVASYWFVVFVLDALGTSPEAIVEGIRAIIAAF